MSTSTRKVTIKITTQKDAIVMESSARTFGELKAEAKNVKWDGMRVVERATKATLQLPDALLPAGDFILFVVPEKVKSGADSIDIEKANYNELRSHISFLNKMKGAKLSLDGKVDDLRATLRSYYSGKGETVPAQVESVIETIEESRANINSAVDALVEAIKSGSFSTATVDNTEYVIKTSVDDLEKELSEIKSKLNL